MTLRKREDTGNEKGSTRSLSVGTHFGRGYGQHNRMDG
jgi:hypothetical protein